MEDSSDGRVGQHLSPGLPRLALIGGARRTEPAPGARLTRPLCQYASISVWPEVQCPAHLLGQGLSSLSCATFPSWLWRQP